MFDENKTYTRFSEQLKSTYRLVVMNDETFEEVGSYRLTRLNIYMIVSTILVLVVLFVSTAIIFTPLKHYIPGYGDVNLRSNSIKLANRVDSLENALKAQNAYIINIRNILTGNIQHEIIDESEEALEEDTSAEFITPIDEDYALREAVEREELEGGNSTALKVSNFEQVRTSIEQILFIPPLKGTVSAEFDLLKKHYGIDVIAPSNTPVKVVTDGVVIASDWTFDTGNVITVQHDNNLVSFYKHNSVLLKKVGTLVKAGEAVALIGNTGEQSDGPHLHFELWHNGKPINPRKYIIF